MKKKFIVISSLLILLAITAALFYVRRVARNQVQAEISKSTELAAEQLKDRVELFIDERIVALEEVGDFYENSEEVTDTEFENFARSTIEDVPGFQAIEYIDSNYIIRQIYPLEQNRQDYGRDLKRTSLERSLSDKSQEHRMVILTDLLELIQGGLGFMVYVPVYKKERFEGFVCGIFKVDDLLGYFITEDVEKKFSLHVRDSGGKTIYATHGSVAGQGDFEVLRTMNVGDKKWQIEIWPKGEALSVQTKVYDLGVFGFGTLFMLSVGSLVWFLVRRSEVLEKEVEKRTKKLEEKTQEVEEKNKELAAKNEEMESFIYTVSHDLKAPVISLQGMASLLQLELGNTLKANATLYLERIQANTMLMQRLISELLELSRIGRLTEPKQPVKMNDLIREVLNELQGQIELKQATITVVDDLPTMTCERSRLQQVWMNLIANALHYCRPDVPPVIEIGARDGNNSRSAFFVRDNGIGIAQEHQEKIFDIFYRVEGKYDGSESTGVGLAIVKRIIESHGGKVWVESDGRDRGSTFWFTLPTTVKGEN